MGKLTDGFGTTLAFSTAGSQTMLYLFDTGVTPPGLSGGGAVDMSTMENTKYRTFVPRQLIGGSPASVVGAYDSALFDEILDAVNVNQEMVITFPDASTLTFWGWIDEFTPNAHVDGEMPTANITIIPSFWDGSAEIAPVIG